MSSIDFFEGDTGFELSDPDSVRAWLVRVADGYGFAIAELSYVFMSDDELLQMNQEYLDHDTYTDIITFVLNEGDSKDLVIDIFISIDRVRENAGNFSASFTDELHRVMAHGVLHAMGLDDKEEASRAEMRKAEDLALSLRQF